MDEEQSFKESMDKSNKDDYTEPPPPEDFMNALKILNGDVDTILELIKQNYHSRIFGSVGEHLVFLRKKEKLKEIAEYLNEDQRNDTESYQLNNEIDTFYPQTEEARSFIDSFLDLARCLNYQEIILLFDPHSIRDPVKSGLLKKYTNVLKQYKTRYVILFDDTFAYYKIKEGKRMLRKRIAFNIIHSVRTRNKKLIITTYDEKIIFKGDAATIQSWYKCINTKLNDLKVTSQYETHYLLNLLYFKFNKLEREELSKYRDFTPFLHFYQQKTEIQPVKSDQDVFYDFQEESAHIDTFLHNYFNCLISYEHHDDDRCFEFYTSSSNIDTQTLPERLAEFPCLINNMLFSFFTNPQQPNIHIEILLVYALLKFYKQQSKRRLPRLVPHCDNLEIHHKQEDDPDKSPLHSFVTINKHKFVLTSASKYLDFTLDISIKPHYENLTELHIKNRSKAVIWIKQPGSIKPFIFTFPDLVVTDRIVLKHSCNLHHASYQYTLKPSCISHQLVIDSAVYQIETDNDKIRVMKNCEIVDMEDIGHL